MIAPPPTSHQMLHNLPCWRKLEVPTYSFTVGLSVFKLALTENNTCCWDRSRLFFSSKQHNLFLKIIFLTLETIWVELDHRSSAITWIYVLKPVVETWNLCKNSTKVKRRWEKFESPKTTIESKWCRSLISVFHFCFSILLISISRFHLCLSVRGKGVFGSLTTKT